MKITERVVLCDPHTRQCTDTFSTNKPNEVDNASTRRIGSGNVHFLDGSTHLYMRVCPSVRRMDGPSDGWSVGW